MNPIPSANMIPLWRRISTQLILNAVLPLTIAIAITVSTILGLVQNQFETQVLNQLTSIAELKHAELSLWIASTHATLDVLADNGALTDEFNLVLSSETPNSVFNETLAETANSVPTFQNIFVYTPAGKVVAASDSKYIGRVVSRQPYFVPSLTLNNTTHPPFYSVGDRQLTIVTTHLLHDANKQVIGVLAATLNPSTLADIMLQRAGLGDTGETYLVSLENNYFLTPSRFEDYSQNRAYTSEGIENALKQRDGAGIYEAYRGQMAFGVYRWIPELESALMAEMDVSEGLLIVQAIFQTSTLVALISIIVAAGVGLYTAIRLARPIATLTEATTHLAEGNLQERAIVSSKSELGVLASSFNTMAERLETTVKSLDTKVKEVEDANRNLKLANAKAKEATRLKSEFLANMSHELRTPLNAIIGFTGIMMNGFGGELDDDAQHMVTRVYENSQNLLTLINSVLDIAKIEAGRMEIVSAPLQIRTLVKKWESDLAVLAQQRNLHFTTEVDQDMPDILYGDSERLTQIVNNLLSNAFKFTSKGEVNFHVKRHKHTWQLIVKDTGIGIPPHALNYIFDEFRQVDGSSTRVYGGSGLGLAITRNLCLMMGGHIAVTSTLQVGSTFTVTLPLKLFETEEFEPVVMTDIPAKEVL